MKIPNWAKKTMIIAGALYSFNSFAVPVSWYFICFSKFGKNVENPNIQQVMETKKYIHDFEGNDQKTALKYLKLAHAITMKYLTIEDYKSIMSDNKKLHKKIGNCTETSKFTYSNFLFLISKSNKMPLAGYVRIADGIASNNYDETGHVWLEIKQNGKWVPYETVRNDLEEYNEITPQSIDELVLNSNVLNPEDMSYHRTNMYRINKNGKNKPSLDILGMLTDYKGLAYSIVKLLTY